MKTQQGFIAVIVIIIVVLAATGGYVYVKKQTPKTQESTTNIPTTTTQSTDQDKGDVTWTEPVKKDSPDFSYEADIKSTVNCGSQDCFNKKFASCEPATIQSEIEGMGSVSYKIINKTSAGCNLTFKYTKYPDPTWENKEMTCPFNNSLSFEAALQKVFMGVTTGEVVCTGPLYKILHP